MNINIKITKSTKKQKNLINYQEKELLTRRKWYEKSASTTAKVMSNKNREKNTITKIF